MTNHIHTIEPLLEDKLSFSLSIAASKNGNLIKKLSVYFSNNLYIYTISFFGESRTTSNAKEAVELYNNIVIHDDLIDNHTIDYYFQYLLDENGESDDYNQTEYDEHSEVNEHGFINILLTVESFGIRNELIGYELENGECYIIKEVSERILEIQR